MKEARADHKVRASSGTPERDGEWLEPVFIPYVRQCLQIHARHNVQPAAVRQQILGGRGPVTQTREWSGWHPVPGAPGLGLVRSRLVLPLPDQWVVPVVAYSHFPTASAGLAPGSRKSGMSVRKEYRPGKAI